MAIIDWIALTLPIAHSEKQPGHHAFMQRVLAVVANMQDLFPAMMQSATDDLTVCTTQRPYRHAWTCTSTGWRINADWKRKEALIVFNGAACEMLRKMGGDALSEVLRQTERTGTRLDLATDIPTTELVRGIEAAGWSKRIKSTSFISSQSGDTVYVGSRSSGAFARVYRYASPHPRSALLRVEHEMKKEQARAVAALAWMHGVDSAQRSVAAKFDYKHPVLIKAFAGTSHQIVTERHQRTLAATEMWLMTQCAPAFQRLVREGVISDPAKWVNRYMLGDL